MRAFVDTFLERATTLKMLYISHLPVSVVHRITLRCDCRCAACNWWDLDRYEVDMAKELSLEQVSLMLRDLKANGIQSYIVSGGEPLLRSDIGVVLKTARDLGMETILTTNGNPLEDHAEELARHCSILIISLDGIGETHDEVRGRKGTFERAVRGLAGVKKHNRNMDIRFWSQVNNKTMDQMDGLVELAREYGATVEFFPTHRLAGHNEHLLLSPAQVSECMERIRALKSRDREGRIRTSYASLRTTQRARPYRWGLPCFLWVAI